VHRTCLPEVLKPLDANTHQKNPQGYEFRQVFRGLGEPARALKPSRGVGIDFSSGMIGEAKNLPLLTDARIAKYLERTLNTPFHRDLRLYRAVRLHRQHGSTYSAPSKISKPPAANDAHCLSVTTACSGSRSSKFLETLGLKDAPAAP